MSDLPIEDVLPELISALRTHRSAVLAAPPGAGKTTRVPLALLEAGLTDGRILVLEPRRIAARAAATRMAQTLGERPGETVGYRIRGEARVRQDTRIEVITEGILTRMLLSDPELSDIGAILFDEIHERSIHADLGLALALESREALRDDLILLPMSATLDTARFAALMGGIPEIASTGRAFPVDIRYRDRPLPRDRQFERAVAGAVVNALSETDGGVLVFLPGEGEIRRVAALLTDTLPKNAVLRPLYGSLPARDQDSAIRPDPEHRKVVLATAIAETSLTIEDMRVVVDAGLARRSRVDPASGMSRLVTERVSRAEADQRAGRAGRVAAGVAYRLWTRGEHGGLAAFAPPEIETADLTETALALAAWGVRRPDDVALPDQPPARTYAEAIELLKSLDALDGDSIITGHGRALSELPVHPRLGQMLLRGGAKAAPLAALLSDRDPLRGEGSDLDLRLKALSSPNRDPALHRLRSEARRLERFAGPPTDLSTGALTALAYPDRVALRRAGSTPRFLLSGGRGARLPETDVLAGSRLLAVAETDGAQPEATVRLAAPVTEDELRNLYPDRITSMRTATWSPRDGKVVARIADRFGAIALREAPWHDAPDETLDRAMLDGVRALGLNLSARAERLCRRAELARRAGADIPPMHRAGLLEDLETWLMPWLSGVRTAADWAAFDAHDALVARLGWNGAADVDRIAPGSWTTPVGRSVPVDYDAEVPSASVRLQEVFGVTTHPQVGGKPLRLTLLSPASRPVQVTTDLPGFWATSYSDVRKDMRGRYPKHPWPEDPTASTPTLRAKPRR